MAQKIAAEWGQLTDDDKKPFQAQQAQFKADYLVRKAAYDAGQGRGAAPVAVAAAAASMGYRGEEDDDDDDDDEEDDD